MEESLALQVVRAFVTKLNAHAVDDLATLMTDDHRYVAASGCVTHGRELVCQHWLAYFAQVPDYAMTCEHVIAAGRTSAIFGKAGGVRAAWKVVVRGTWVAEWHEYRDTRGDGVS